MGRTSSASYARFLGRSSNRSVVRFRVLLAVPGGLYLVCRLHKFCCRSAASPADNVHVWSLGPFRYVYMMNLANVRYLFVSFFF